MRLYNVFLKYCLRYFIGLLLLLICCLLLANVAYRSIESYVVEENQLKLSDGVHRIEQNISKMDLISQVVKQDPYFRALAQLEGPLPPDRYLNLKYASEQMTNISYIYTFSTYSFSLFRDNDLYISSSQRSASYTGYYGTYLQVNDGGGLASGDFKAQLFQRARRGLSFWQADSIRFHLDGQEQVVENPILCLVRDNATFGTNGPFVMVFILRPEDLVREILTQDGMQEGMVFIADAVDGRTLLSHSAGGGSFMPEDPDYRYLPYSVPSLGWDVTIAFPQSIIDNQCREIRSVLNLYILVGSLFVLCLTLYFSYRQYSSVKRLFTGLPGGGRPLEKGQNEYDVLSRLLQDISNNREDYEQQIGSLEQRMRAVQLENLFVRGITSHEERQLFENFFPRPLDVFCVALLTINAEDEEQARLAVLFINEYLRESYPREFLNVHSGTSDELYLLTLSPSDPPNVKGIQQLFQGIIQVLTEDMGITISAGLSAIGTDIANINACYNQARQVIQAYYRENQNLVGVYRVDMNAAHENMVSMEFMEKLHNLLLCAEREAIRVMFDRLVTYYQKMPFQYETQKQQIFYTIRNIIHSAYLHLPVDTPVINNLPEYGGDVSIREMADTLYRAACGVCDRIEEGRKSRNNDLKVRIMEYLEENYALPSLTAGQVCHEMGISEKYLYGFIKEQTGETFAGYLERIRIQAAMEYLTTTDLSNEKIAGQTGFAAVNTFYRAFNKRTGVSPGTYRSNHSTLAR